MYDIINVFEGIEVVARRSRGEYQWYGFDKLPDAIRRQKMLGPLESCSCTEEDRDEDNDVDHEMSKTESKVFFDLYPTFLVDIFEVSSSQCANDF